MKPSQHIIDEWKALVPDMQPPEHPSFARPPAYFETLPQEILQRIREDARTAETKEEQPTDPETLSWPRSMPYHLPEAYFEQLPASTFEKIVASGNTRKMRPGRRLWMHMSVAAAVAAIIAVGGIRFYQAQHLQRSFDEELAQLPEQAIEEYLDDHIGLSDDEALNPDDAQGSSGISRFTEGISNDALEQYLNDYDFDDDVHN